MSINYRQVVGVLEPQTRVVQTVAASMGAEGRRLVQRQQVALLPEAARHRRELQSNIICSVAEAPRVSRAERELRTFIFPSEARARRRVPLGVESRREQGRRRPRVAARRRGRRRALEAEVARRAGLVRPSCPRHIADVARRAQSWYW